VTIGGGSPIRFNAEMGISLDNFSTLFALTGRATRARAERVLNDFGLHVGQQHILECLWDQDGLTVGELATRIAVEVPTLGRAIRRMEPAGVIERRPDEEDGRRVRLWLTPAGRHLRYQLRPALKALEEELLSGLSDAERVELVRLLQRVYEAAMSTRTGIHILPPAPSAANGSEMS
jgi:DNA-binding MarR family transcriptional regulator